MSEPKFILITKRDENGYLIGTKGVLVKWNCPTCNAVMGEPRLSNIHEDGQSYAVHTWVNKCGHVALYEDLVEVRSELDE